MARVRNRRRRRRRQASEVEWLGRRDRRRFRRHVPQVTLPSPPAMFLQLACT